MIEAFEIGVSLALRDGVSEGIAAARRDMALVEAAIRGTGVSLRDLQRAGNRALDTTRYRGLQIRDQNRVSPDTRRVVDTAKQRDDGGALLHGTVFLPALVGQETKPVAAGVAPAMQATTQDAVSDRAWVAPAARPAVREVPDAVSLEESPRVFAPVTMVADRTVRTIDENGAADTAREPAGWLGMVPGSVVAPPASAMPISAAPVNIQIAGPQPRPAEVEQPWVPYDAGGAPMARPTGPMAYFAGVSTAAAPCWSDQRSVAANAVGTPPSAPQRPPSEGAPEEAPTAMRGDVFLDGALVGRWMSRFLAKQAGRAAVGPTGFDPRRNPVLPGPTIGL